MNVRSAPIAPTGYTQTVGLSVFLHMKTVWYFLQTGEMEVKNPLFQDDQTPAPPAPAADSK